MPECATSARLSLKHPFVNGVQQVASSNLAGPTSLNPCEIQGFAGGGGFGLKSQSIHGVNTQRRAACPRGTGRGVKSGRFSSCARRWFGAASRCTGWSKSVRKFTALRIFWRKVRTGWCPQDEDGGAMPIANFKARVARMECRGHRRRHGAIKQKLCSRALRSMRSARRNPVQQGSASRAIRARDSFGRTKRQEVPCGI